jgi:flavin-binding protein dodecin
MTITGRLICMQAMSVAKVTEIIASSPESFDDAVNKGIKRAGETLENVRSAWVNLKAELEIMQWHEKFNELPD